MNNWLAQIDLLPDLLLAHLHLSISALLIAISIALPLGVYIYNKPQLKWLTLSVTSVFQTIPSLALLAIMVPILSIISDNSFLSIPSFGFYPALFALSIYGLLPILSNTITGFSSINKKLEESADALGMTYWQKLRLVMIPLSLPIIITGIRTSAVWIIATATLATPIGQPSLGNFIFSGLQTRNWYALSVGVIASATLTIFVDLFLARFEKAIQKKRFKRFLLISFVFLILVFIFSLINYKPSKSEITIGAKNFSEQYILSSFLEKYLNDYDFTTKKVENLGSNFAFEALRNKDIDVYVEYVGTLWFNFMRESEIIDGDEIKTQVVDWLREQELELIAYLGFENTYAIAVPDTKDFENIHKISDLENTNMNLVIGSDYEFYQRLEWVIFKEKYNIIFSSEKSFDSTFMYEAIKREEVNLITAFSTDGRIAAYNLKILEDDREAFPPYDAILLANKNIKPARNILLKLEQSIDTNLMRKANEMVDIKRESIEAASQWLLEEIGKR